MRVNGILYYFDSNGYRITDLTNRYWELLPLLPNDSECRETLGRKIPKAGNISDYIQKNASYPVYQNTDVI